MAPCCGYVFVSRAKPHAGNSLRAPPKTPSLSSPPACQQTASMQVSAQRRHTCVYAQHSLLYRIRSDSKRHAELSIAVHLRRGAAAPILYEYCVFFTPSLAPLPAYARPSLRPLLHASRPFPSSVPHCDSASCHHSRVSCLLLNSPLQRWSLLWFAHFVSSIFLERPLTWVPAAHRCLFYLYFLACRQDPSPIQPLSSDGASRQAINLPPTRFIKLSFTSTLCFASNVRRRAVACSAQDQGPSDSTLGSLRWEHLHPCALLPKRLSRLVFRTCGAIGPSR